MIPITSTRMLLGIGLATALLSACGGGSSDNFDDRINAAAPVARLVHAASGAPAVTLFRNGTAEPSASNVEYRSGTPYYEVPTGNAAFSLRTASGGSEVATATIDAGRGHKYTLIAMLTSSGVDLTPIDDPYNKSLTSDNARVRVVNASVNAQNVDIYLTAPSVDLNTVNPTVPAVGYRQVRPATGENSVELEGGTYWLRITAQGSKTTIYTRQVEVPRNADWLLVTIPDPGVSVLNPGNIRVLQVGPDSTVELPSTLQ
ncbi:MAG TPA: DUF4397 domain-containing protein [Burkholderiaceae bacterium]|nr:DUF4397 domain-containing protein [Burkholderiaceae bacterium]